MKSASAKEIKDELKTRSSSDLMALCLRLSRFKKENKELLTYLLFEADNENFYVEGVKDEIDELYSEINLSTAYFTKKGIRKVLRQTKKYIRYSNEKSTEIELLIHFCRGFLKLNSRATKSTVMENLYDRQVTAIQKALEKIHEDLRYDYEQELLNLGGDE